MNLRLNEYPTDALVVTSPLARFIRRSTLMTMLVTGAIALAAPALRAQPALPVPAAKPPFPGITLPDRAQGQQALSQLGSHLPEVAAWYGMSVAEFSNMMRFDRTAWLDRRGRVFFEEEVQLPSGTTEAAAQADPLSTELEPLDQTFKLNSRPGARRTIYLNFVGASLTSTAWNSASQPTITAQPFDLDNVPYSFSTAELQRIQYIWKRVAEDYAAFDVNVTTEPPPADRLTRSSTSDDIFGTTVLITKRTFYNCSCGGVAYLTAFDDTTDFYKPALVFYDALGSGNEKYVADAISHEAGHNVGLGHDGTSGSSYYTGHGSGATGWAPIMGVGYYQQLVQWSKGEYAGANNEQDDYVVMQNTGLPLRSDDHGNSNSTATPLAGSTSGSVTTFGGSGVIERPTDVDVFSFTAGAGSVTVNVSPAPRAPKLDILATLRDGAGTVLATSNPTDSLPASLTANITAAGTYYVTVDGVGKGDPLVTGYTDYGSVGQYSVNVTSQSTASQPPTAVLSANPTSGSAPLTVNFSAAGSTDSDGTIVSYLWNFGDGGSQTGGTTAQRIYSTAGSYTASLTVTDNAGLTDTETVSITVQPQTITYALTVTKTGAGTGTVSSSPAGISCGTDCAENYSSGTSVILTASPAAGSTFAGWSGACTGTGTTCTVGMTAARSVTANFNPASYPLTVSKGGLATGTVVSNPAGIDCGTDCAQDYAYGTSVTLTATPASGATFAGWSGACSGTGNCLVSMASSRTVTANFDVPKSLSVADIAMSLRVSRSRTDALAAVTVRDAAGNLVPGATVTGTWSGEVSGNASLVTDSSGVAAFRSPRVRNSGSGVFTFTVAGIALSGYTYDPNRNVETSDSISR